MFLSVKQFLKNEYKLDIVSFSVAKAKQADFTKFAHVFDVLKFLVDLDYDAKLLDLIKSKLSQETAIQNLTINTYILNTGNKAKSFEYIDTDLSIQIFGSATKDFIDGDGDYAYVLNIEAFIDNSFVTDTQTYKPRSVSEFESIKNEYLEGSEFAALPQTEKNEILQDLDLNATAYQLQIQALADLGVL